MTVPNPRKNRMMMMKLDSINCGVMVNQKPSAYPKMATSDAHEAPEITLKIKNRKIGTPLIPMAMGRTILKPYINR